LLGIATWGPGVCQVLPFSAPDWPIPEIGDASAAEGGSGGRE